MSWNHRILAHKEDDAVYLQIHEVYYNKKGIPDGYTARSISATGETIEEITHTLDKMKRSTTKAILWAGDRFPEEYIK